MGTTQPIRKPEEIEQLKEYFLRKGEVRNYALITMGINTALRISDLLELKWKDVWNFSGNCFRRHMTLWEQKTGKQKVVYLNAACRECLCRLKSRLGNSIDPELYLFQSRVGDNRHIGRNRAYTLIRNAWHELGYEGNVSCHSLRKTFGYHAWRKGVSPAVIMTIYNHSSMDTTKRYLSVEQDEKDDVYRNLVL
jgi:integrase